MTKFIITNHKGFHLSFNNGWQVSVQFGPSNYCERRYEDYDSPIKSESWQSKNAEVAVWRNFGKQEMIMLENDVVRGWTSPREVAELLYLVSTAQTFNNEEMTKRLSKVWKPGKKEVA
jgi:hypothetical protein|tara:strand:- start:334 stop:687 length:354 start_codon:yes stop_codon:yes gene_type:complete